MGADSIYCGCGHEADLVDGTVIYPHRPDLAAKLFYRCHACAAYVGCHETTALPMGRLANADERYWRHRAHAAFDQLWERKMKREGCSKKKARGEGYGWLSKQLAIDPAKCHIGMMGVEDCKRVVSACAPYTRGR